MDSKVFQYVREDDFVECFIFPFSNDLQVGDDHINSIFQDVQEMVNILCQKYVWHKDPFKIHKRLRKTNTLSLDTNPDLPAHIYGVCHYGDNIEDEWFIVYIVKEITKKINSLVARIVDSDGEFLLIEAANSLPPWASPSNCTNRVFFYKGGLHLISPDNYDNIKEITINEALSQMCASSEEHTASAGVQNDIFQHIDEYPSKISNNFHRTTIYTPVGVAALLKEDPSLISAAVHAFCQRDPIDLKVCRAMKYFPPENRVNTSVTFTKFLYAMLLHNNFNPDRRTGWNLPLVNSPQFKSHSLGVKLACGFEILVSQAQPSCELENNKAWRDYVQSLNNRNYFQGLLEGSNGYNTLLDNAKNYFSNNLNFLRVQPKLGGKVLGMLGNFSLDDKEFRKNEPFLPNDDDDKWLYVDPKELESMVQKRYGRKTFFPMNGDTEPSGFSTKISEFLEHTSGIEGVEFPSQSEGTSDDFPQRPKRGIKKGKAKGVSFSDQTDSTSLSPPGKSKINFDADQFSSAIQNILDLVIPEDNWDLESGSDVSEYGSSDELETNILEIASSESKDRNTLHKYMAKMDSELAKTDLAKSFETSKSSKSVDIDANALKNIQKSFQEELGGMGPAGSILGPLGYTKTENIIAIDDEID